VSNPSFENGTTGWTPYNGQLTSDTYAAQCGSKAGHFKHSSNTGGFYQVIAGLTVGTSLELSFYGGVHESAYNQRFGLRYYNSSGTQIGEDYVNVNGPLPDMSFYTVYSTVPANTAKVQVEGWTNGDWLKVDQICLTITSVCNPDNSSAPPFCAPTPICETGDFLWSQSVTSADGNVSKVRLICSSKLTYTIPGPYPVSFGAATNIQISDVVSYDGYAGRNSVTQLNERWRLVFRKNGITVATTPYTTDVPDQKTQAYWRGSLGSVSLPNGTDEIRIEHWAVANDASCNGGPNSVSPISVCLKSSPICFNFGSAILSDLNLVKTRTIQNQITCGSEPDRVIYFSCLLDKISGGTAGNRKLWKIISGGTFKEYCDGKAYTELTIQNVELSSYKFKMNLIFSGRTYTAPAGNPHLEGCTSSKTSNWYYYSEMSGSMVGLEALDGAVVSLDLSMAAFQLGTNASLYGVLNNFGASAWFDYSVLMHPTTFQLVSGCQADFNMFLTGGSLSSTDAAACGEICVGQTANLNSVAAGGKAPYTFNWSNGLGTGDTKTVNPTTTTTYTITATDANSCTSTSQIIIKVVPGPNVNAGVDQASCPGGSFNLNATASGGTSPYTFNWSNGLGSGANKTVSPASTTTYTVTVTDAKGCTATDQVKVTVHPAPSVTAVKTNAKCGFNNGTATATGSGGTSPYTYLWSNGATGSTISGLAAGPYSVTLTDAKSCTANTSVTVGSDTGPSVSAGADQASCPGGTFTLTATGSGGTSPYTYAWSNNLGSGSTKSVSPASTTTYTVTVTDANGCTAADNVKITIHPAPSVSAVKVNAKCGFNNGSATATGSGGTSPYTYLWSNGGTSNTISGLAAGPYSVTLTDANGCKANASVTVGSDAGPSVSAGADQASCPGGTFTLTATGSGGTSPYTYSWSNNLGSGSTKSVSPASTTTYTVTVSDANGCTATDHVKITIHPAPSVTAVKVNAKCGLNNGSATATGSGGTSPYTYLWSNGSTSNIISGLSAGPYSVTLTDANGCKANASITVGSDPNPSVSAGPDQSSCPEETVTLTATGSGGTSPYSYAWSNNLGSGSTKSVSPNSTTTYFVTVTDANGCTATDDVKVSIHPAPSVSITKVDATCGQNNGSATANGTGGTAGYTYLWSNGAMSQSISGLGTGPYFVTLTDSKGCKAFASITIVSSNGPNVNAGPDQNICLGSQATISATATGGTSPYMYAWSHNLGSGPSKNVSPTISTIYTVTATDVNGCSSTDQVEVKLRPNPEVNAGADKFICSGASTNLTATASGGTPAYTFSWSNGLGNGASKNVNPITNTSYYVTVTDANLCFDIDTVAVIVTGPCACVADLTTTVSGCDPSNNHYSLTGQISFVNPPLTGTLTVSTTAGGSQTFTAPFVSPIAYNITGLNSDAANRSITATFSADQTCTKTLQYKAPPSCKCVIDNLTAIPGPCDPATNLYNLSGQVFFTNPPTTGTLVISIVGLGTQTFFPPFGSPIFYSLSALPSDGATRTVTAHFSSYPTCTFSKNYAAPVQCKTGPNITHTKELVSITQTGPRTYSVNYKIDVRNLGGTTGLYNLSDAPNFDDDITITGSSYSTLNIPGNPAAALPGNGPWVLATQRSLDPGFVHTYNISIQVSIDLSPGSSGNNLYSKCGFATPGDPNRGEGLFNESFLDKNNDGIPDEIREACGDIPYIVHTKTISSVFQTSARTFRVIYNIKVENLGGADGRYTLRDAPNFDDDIAITSTSFTSDAPGIPGTALAGPGPWTLANNQLLSPSNNHNFNITVHTLIDLRVGSNGDNLYKKCGTANPGIPQTGEGLFNQSFLDINNDGIPDENKYACGDIPYITHQKTISSLVQTGPRSFRVIYKIDVQNKGGISGNYTLTDAPGFDNDIAINSSSYTSNAPGFPGGNLAGSGPWTLATNQSLASNGTHSFFVTVNLSIDLSAQSPGDKTYRKCGQTLPGQIQPGEGLFNQSRIDVNNDGTPDETSDVCGDIPYITHVKTIQNVTQTGTNSYQIVYQIVVRNLGGVSGNYGLKDSPLFDDDLAINGASYTSNAPGNPAGVLAGSGPWTLATNQAIVSGGIHTYSLTVQVTLDISPGSSGNNVYHKCGYTTPGIPREREGLFNRSLLDINNDGVTDEFSEVCADLPSITHRKEISSITRTGPYTFRVTYRIIVENTGGGNGRYRLTDQPVFDDDITIVNTNFTTDAPGVPAGNLAGSGPWVLGTGVNINIGATHIYTLNVDVSIDLKPGSTGDNIYRRCGQTTPGTPISGEGLFNRSLLDVNEDGIPDEIREVCGDIPYITHQKTVQNIVQTGANTFRINYNIVVKNIGGVSGNYGLKDQPAFDNDLVINSASYTSSAPGFPGSALAGTGPWTLATNQALAAGGQHTFTVTVNVTLDLSPASAGDKVYKRCGYATPGIPTSGEGLFNRSLLDVNNDGTPDEISTACEDIPQMTHRKEINSIVNIGLNSYRVTYRIIVENKGGVSGKYTLTDRPIFDDDIAITSSNYSSDVPGIPGSALIGTGPWTLATNQNINGGATHTFTLVVNVNLDLKPGSGGNNVYTRCGQAQQGIPAAGEGLFNRSLLDVNEDGIPDEIREVCGDIPYITHIKTVQSVTQTGLNTYRVNYNIEVRNTGGTVGNYGLSDAPSFDDDIAINNANFTSTAPGNPGSALAGNGPWQLANNLSINAGALHVYTLTVNVTLDLRPVTGGDNVYRKCGQTTPGVPKQGEGLFNRSLLDANNDGTPDEISEVCEDIPYITHQKTVQTVTQTGTNTFSVSYQIVVRNTGGVQGRYGLNDQPAFDNDILINSASFTSNAPGIPGSALAGLGPWILATNHPIAAGAQHTYIVTVNVTLDLSPASAGDKVYRRCGQGTPGVPTLGEGLFNRSLLDVNNDGNPDEISTACEDLPQLTHRKEISSITNTGLNAYRVTYRIIVENKGGVTGRYTLTDRPYFDDDIAINSANYSSDFVGGPGGPLFGTGPWTLATLQNIGANTTHVFTLVVNVNLDLRLSSGGNNIYSKCGQSRQGIPSEGEGLFNRSLLDVNADGIPDEIREVCGDIPAIEHEKRFLNSVRQPNGSYNVSYVIDVCNKGGAVGSYTLRDKPAFDDDININSTRFQKNFAGPFTVLANPVPGSGWLLANLTNLAAGACDQFVIEFNVSIDLSPASGGDNIYRNCGSTTPTPRAGEGLFNESLLDLTNDGVPDQRDTVCRDIPFIVHQKNFISAELQPNQTYLVTYQIEVCNSGGASGLYDLYDKPEMDDDVNIHSASYQSTVHGNTNLSTPVPFNGWLIGNDINLGANTCHTYTLRFNLSIDLNPGTPGDNIYKKCGESIPGIPKSGEGLFNLSLLDLDNDGVPEQKDTACTDIITGLGDCVWNDLNYNGHQDPGEPGVKGVKANLYRCDGTFITSTTTNDMGKYFFIGIAGNQSYYVKFDKTTLPPAFEFTKSNVGINDALDSDPDATGTGPCLYVPTGKIDSTYDAGLVKLATIGNFVWVDKNGNGFQEFDEEGVHNVTVKLIDAITKTVVKTEITDITGYYLIRSVRPGSYYLQFEWPDSLITTKPKAGNDVLDSDVNDANGIRTTAVTDLTAGEVDLTWDLGLVVCSSIGGRVFLDANSDGIFNQNENGINGLRVFLVDATNHKVIRTFITKVDPTTPSNDGWYNFTCLPPGSYYIQYERIPELVATPPYAGTNPAKYSYITHELGINTTRIFITISGSLFQNVNGGFQIRSSLGDFVWFDGNYNGLQDPGELPLPDVQVLAYSRDGKLVGEAISGDNGYFDLDVPAGDVYIKVNTKQQFAFTIPHRGDDEFNSDVDGTNGYGTTRTYRVQSSSALPNVDVGLIYGVLPVEWVEVEANRKGESNEILWTTGAELYCKRFEIERRFENESSFKQIGIQSARGSAQGKITDYFMYDFDIVQDGIYYYRIKQVDETGAYTYSKVVSVLVNRNQTNFLSVYPIPAQEILNVDFWLYQDGESTIKIVDQTGKVILNSGEPVFRTKGKHQEKMDIAHFPPGNYVIQVMTNFGVLQQKFTKTH